MNTKYAYFGITNGFSSAYVANTHYPIVFNGQLLSAESDVDLSAAQRGLSATSGQRKRRMNNPPKNKQNKGTKNGQIGLTAERSFRGG